MEERESTPDRIFNLLIITEPFDIEMRYEGIWFKDFDCEFSVMSLQKMIELNGSPALLLTQELLEKLGVGIGDELDLTVEGRTLIIRPTDETERRARMDGAMKELMKRRRKVYERLAEGAQ